MVCHIFYFLFVEREEKNFENLEDYSCEGRKEESQECSHKFKRLSRKRIYEYFVNIVPWNVQ